MHDPLSDLTAHGVCQGRTLETVLDLAGRQHLLDEADAETRARRIYSELTAPLPPDPERSVVALIGDYPHNPAYIRQSLEPVFAGAGVNAAFVYDVQQFGPECLTGAKVLVVLRDGMLWPEPGGEPVWWMTDEQERAIADYVANGGGLLALHNSTALRKIDDSPCLYRDVLGASYSGHGASDERFDVRVIEHDHPITAGVADYPAIDERHWPIVHVDDAVILLRAYSGGEQSINAFVRGYGRGRVCYLANGHTPEMLTCDSMRRLIANALHWCAGH